MRLNDSSGRLLLCKVINRFSYSRESAGEFYPTSALIDLLLLRGGAGIKLDFSERAFVLTHVLLQDGQQRFGLLRTEIDPLKVLHFDVLLVHRLQASKHQQKVP